MSGMRNEQSPRTPVLAINIPIYNRGDFLRRMLDRFSEDQDLFEEKVSLFISDNCSEENLSAIVEEFCAKGLTVQYHRNDVNVGGDRNIINCFRRMGGRYVWVLGSDDIPSPGCVREIVNLLESGEYGMLSLDNYSGQQGLHEYERLSDYLEHIYVWITFVSGNIVKAEFIPTVNLEAYMNTSISQVYLYLTASNRSACNAVYSRSYLDAGSDIENNGGYNPFEVFCEKLFAAFRQFEDEGVLSKQTFLAIKKNTYNLYIVKLIVDILIGGKNKGFKTENAWRILFKHYGTGFYAYVYLAKELFCRALNKVKKCLL